MSTIKKPSPQGTQRNPATGSGTKPKQVSKSKAGEPKAQGLQKEATKQARIVAANAEKQRLATAAKKNESAIPGKAPRAPAGRGKAPSPKEPSGPVSGHLILTNHLRSLGINTTVTEEEVEFANFYCVMRALYACGALPCLAPSLLDPQKYHKFKLHKGFSMPDYFVEYAQKTDPALLQHIVGGGTRANIFICRDPGNGVCGLARDSEQTIMRLDLPATSCKGRLIISHLDPCRGKKLNSCSTIVKTGTPFRSTANESEAAEPYVFCDDCQTVYRVHKHVVSLALPYKRGGQCVYFELQTAPPTTKKATTKSNTSTTTVKTSRSKPVSGYNSDGGASRASKRSGGLVSRSDRSGFVVVKTQKVGSPKQATQPSKPRTIFDADTTNRFELLSQSSADSIAGNKKRKPAPKNTAPHPEHANLKFVNALRDDYSENSFKVELSAANPFNFTPERYKALNDHFNRRATQTQKQIENGTRPDKAILSFLASNIQRIRPDTSKGHVLARRVLKLPVEQKAVALCSFTGLCSAIDAIRQAHKKVPSVKQVKAPGATGSLVSFRGSFADLVAAAIREAPKKAVLPAPDDCSDTPSISDTSSVARVRAFITDPGNSDVAKKGEPEKPVYFTTKRELDPRYSKVSMQTFTDYMKWATNFDGFEAAVILNMTPASVVSGTFDLIDNTGAHITVNAAEQHMIRQNATAFIQSLQKHAYDNAGVFKFKKPSNTALKNAFGPDVLNHINSAEVRREFFEQMASAGRSFSADRVVLIGADGLREVHTWFDCPVVYYVNPEYSSYDTIARKRIQSGAGFMNDVHCVHSLHEVPVEDVRTIWFCSNSIYYVSRTLLTKMQVGDVLISAAHMYNYKNTFQSMGTTQRNQQVLTEYTVSTQTVNTTDRYVHCAITLQNFESLRSTSNNISLTKVTGIDCAENNFYDVAMWDVVELGLVPTYMLPALTNDLAYTLARKEQVVVEHQIVTPSLAITTCMTSDLNRLVDPQTLSAIVTYGEGLQPRQLVARSGRTPHVLKHLKTIQNAADPFVCDVPVVGYDFKPLVQQSRETILRRCANGDVRGICKRILDVMDAQCHELRFESIRGYVEAVHNHDAHAILTRVDDLAGLASGVAFSVYSTPNTMLQTLFAAWAKPGFWTLAKCAGPFTFLAIKACVLAFGMRYLFRRARTSLGLHGESIRTVVKSIRRQIVDERDTRTVTADMKLAAHYAQCIMLRALTTDWVLPFTTSKVVDCLLAIVQGKTPDNYLIAMHQVPEACLSESMIRPWWSTIPDEPVFDYRPNTANDLVVDSDNDSCSAASDGTVQAPVSAQSQNTSRADDSGSFDQPTYVPGPATDDELSDASSDRPHLLDISFTASTPHDITLRPATGVVEPDATPNPDTLLRMPVINVPTSDVVKSFAFDLVEETARVTKLVRACIETESESSVIASVRSTTRDMLFPRDSECAGREEPAPAPQTTSRITPERKTLLSVLRANLRNVDALIQPTWRQSAAALTTGIRQYVNSCTADLRQYRQEFVDDAKATYEQTLDEARLAVQEFAEDARRDDLQVEQQYKHVLKVTLPIVKQIILNVHNESISICNGSAFDFKLADASAETARYARECIADVKQYAREAQADAKLDAKQTYEDLLQVVPDFVEDARAFYKDVLAEQAERNRVYAHAGRLIYNSVAAEAADWRTALVHKWRPIRRTSWFTPASLARTRLPTRPIAIRPLSRLDFNIQRNATWNMFADDNIRGKKTLNNDDAYLNSLVAKQAAARENRYYAGKIQTEPRQLSYNDYYARTRHVQIHDHQVTVTTELNVCIGVLQAMNVPEYFVDNEADCGLINAMIIKPFGLKTVLIFHGPRVHIDQFTVYTYLYTCQATCYAWSTNFEADYPRLYDLQRAYAAQSGSYTSHTTSLAEAAVACGVECTKQDAPAGFYKVYSRSEIKLDAVSYAAADVISVSQIFATSVKGNFDVVVKCGMFNYRLPNDAAKAIDVKHNEDLSFCKHIQQVLSFAELERRITKELGYNVRIINTGSDANIFESNTAGHHCVLQAAFWSAASLALQRRPNMKVEQKSLQETVTSITSLGFAAIAKECASNGVPLCTISRLFTTLKVSDMHSVKLWTPEHLDGHVIAGCSVSRNATINLVIAAGHAYAVVSETALLRFRALRVMNPAQSCDDCAGTRVPDKVCKVMQLVSPNNPALRNASCYLPELGIHIASAPVMQLSLGDLNAMTLLPLARINAAIEQQTSTQDLSSSKIVKTEHGNALTGACVSRGTKLLPSGDLFITKATALESHDPKIVATQLLPIFSGGASYHVSCDCTANVVSAVYNRVANPPTSGNQDFKSFMVKWADKFASAWFEKEEGNEAIADIATTYLDKEVKNLSRKVINKRIKAIKDLGSSAALTLTKLENHTSIFLKREVLLSKLRVGRVIGARAELIRDLCQAINKFVQHRLYQLPGFVKHQTAESIARRLLITAFASIFVFDADFGCFDATQKSWTQQIEEIICKASVKNPEIAKLWSTVIGMDIDMKGRTCRIQSRACRQSGEKSTSWGNTFITYMFTQVMAALVICKNDVEAAKDLLMASAAPHVNLVEQLTLDQLTQLVEGDDNTTASDRPLTGSIQLAADLMGFKVTVCKNYGSGQQFCKYVVTDGTPAPFAWKEFSTSFFKHGWTTQRVRPGSNYAGLLTQCKLMALIASYPQVSGLRSYAAAVQAHLKGSTRIIFDPETLCLTAGASERQTKRIEAAFSDMNFDVVGNQIQARRAVSYEGENAFQINAINSELAVITQRIIDEKSLTLVFEAQAFPQCAGPFVNEDKRFSTRICRGGDLEMTSNELIGRAVQYNLEQTLMQDASQEEKAIISAYKAYADTGNTDGVYLQMLPTSDSNNENPMKVPAHVWVTASERAWILKNFKLLGEHGILAAVGRELYARFRDQNTAKAREYIQKMNAHNDKLGFDYDVTRKQFRYSNSPQFQQSAYKDMIQLASKFQQKYNADYAAHLLKQLAQFTIPPATVAQLAAQGRIKTNATELSYPTQESSRIAGLQSQIDAANEELEQARFEASELARVIRGYNSKTVIEPDAIVPFPQEFRKNLLNIMAQLESSSERHLVQAYADPFHPIVTGVRVPQQVPRETMTFASFADVQVGNTTACLAIMPLAQQTEDWGFVITDASMVTNIMNNTPVATNCTYNGTQVRLLTIDTGTTLAGIASKVSVLRNTTLAEAFVKSRTVAGGMRVMKTSTADNESGVMDQIYSRDGAAYDDTFPLSQEIGRPKPDRQRTYLAGAGQDTCRGRVGLIGQVNYRPHDERSFGMRDIGASLNSDFNELAFAGVVSGLWFAQSTGPTVNLIPGSELLTTGNSGQPLLLVQQSLNVSHTALTYIAGIPAGMTLSIEFIKHHEGIADQTAYGFVQARAAELETVQHPLQLLQSYNMSNIFGDYSQRREFLLNSMMDASVRGFWKETLFPKVKDLIRYGADSMLTGNRTEDLVSAAVDTAATTLGFLVPEFLPFFASAAQNMKQPLANKGQAAIQAVRDWTLRGIRADDEESKS